MASLVGLSGPFSRIAPGHCARCHRVGDATWPWTGWHVLRNLWLCGIGLLLAMSPIIMADIYVVLPLSLVFVSAIGPLSSLTRIRPTCLRCGGVVVGTRIRRVK
jgi:hypothetical protein